MTPENFKAWQKELEVSHIQFNIMLAEKRLARWIKVEEDRRMNPYNFTNNAILFSFIRQAKQHKKEAKADLDYWKTQLKKLAA